MKLTVPERLKLLEIMPLSSTYEGIKDIHMTNLLLNLTGEEADEVDGKIEDGRMFWNQEKALGLIVDIPMGEWMTNTVRQVLRELDHESELDVTEISLFEKFIMDYE